MLQYGGVTYNVKAEMCALHDGLKEEKGNFESHF